VKETDEVVLFGANAGATGALLFCLANILENGLGATFLEDSSF
jgi:hypothetical protein